MARLGVQLAVLAYMTRVLGRDEFGHYTVALAVYVLVDAVADAGMGAAVLQRPEMPAAEVARCHRAARLAGLGAGLLAWALAPLVGLAAGEAECAPLLRVLGVAAVLRGGAAVPVALLVRDLRFVTAALVDTASAVARAAVVVALGSAGLGALAFAWGAVAEVLGQAVLGATFARVPRASPRGEAILPPVDVLRSGRRLATGAVLALAGARIERVLVARLLGAAAAGTYGFAHGLAFLAVERAGGSVGRVAMPIYGRLRHDREAAARAWLTATRWMGATLLPASLAVGILADPLLRAFADPRWWDAAPALRGLSVAAALAAAAGTPFTLWKATGRERMWRDWQGAALVLLVVGVALASRWGLAGVVAFMVLRAAAAAATSAIVSARMLGIRPAEHLRAVAPAVASAAVAAMAATAAMGTAPTAVAESLAGGVVFGGVFGACLVATDAGARRRVAATSLRGR
ncbi:oligosaccharide flippase family protein [Myxococcota bacterium]|nr:oligosaccharide flippase family protein [Myxococcota bacterium]